MADVKVTLKRVIDEQGNTDNIHPTTDWEQVENKPTTFTPTAHTLNSHTDVNASPTADGQVLTWDNTNSIWIASATTGGGVSKSELQNLYIYGKASAAITKGQAVQFAGAQGDHILIKPAVPSEINSNPDYMIGIAETDLSTNDFGYVLINGRLNLDTSTYSAGDILYFDSTVADTTTGALTTTEPTGGEAIIQMAAVSIDGVGNGEFVVRTILLSREIHEVIDLQDSLDAKVDKAGDTMTGNLRIESGSFASLTLDREGATGSGSIVQFENNNGIIGGIGAFGDDGLQFRTTDGTQMVIDASNNVGIGTTSPDYNLNVEGSTGIGIGQSTSTHDLVLSNRSDYADDTGNSHIWISSGGTGAFSGEGAHMILETRRSARNIYFKVGDVDAPQHIMNYSGNVGIGTTNPSGKLSVQQGSGEFTALLGADVTNGGLTNSTRKFTRIGMPHYTNAEQPVSLITGDSDGNDNILSIGGGTSAGNAATQIYLKTAADTTTVDGTTRVFIGSDGNVGIGTTNPSKKLHIVGDARVEGDLTVNGTMTVVDTDVNTTEQWIITNDGTGPAAIINQTGAQPVIDIQDDGTSAFYIEDGGNVGIGTTNPTQKLDVVGNIKLSGDISTNVDNDDLVIHGGTQTGKGAYLQLYGNTRTGREGAGEIVVRENTNSYFNVTSYDGASTWTSRLRINPNNGNVGIGTTSPAVRLHTVSNSTEYQAMFEHDGTTSGYAPGSILLQSGQADSRGAGIYHYNTVADENWFTGVPYSVAGKKWIVANQYGTSQLTNTAQLTHALLTIDSDTGNVGIGTDSPDTKLQVNGNLLLGSSYVTPSGSSWGTSNAQLILGGAHNAEFNNGSAVKLLITGHNNDSPTDMYPIFVEDENGLDDFWLKARASAASGATMYLDGNFGIGTGSPREKLDVIGKIQISNGLTLRDNSIEQHLTNGNANVAVNYYGYANGHTQFRDFDIYNGKGGLIAQFEGSTSRLGIGTGSPGAPLQVSAVSSDNVGTVSVLNTHSVGGAMFPALKVVNTYSNHSYGTVAEFRTENASGTDRPSVIFSSNHTGATWSVGQGGYSANDNFAITYRSAHPHDTGAWGTARLMIDTSGNTGIGTTSPSEKLQVTGNIRFGASGEATMVYDTTSQSVKFVFN